MVICSLRKDDKCCGTCKYWRGDRGGTLVNIQIRSEKGECTYDIYHHKFNYSENKNCSHWQGGM